MIKERLRRLREEMKKNTENHIEKTRNKACEKAEKLEEQLEKKAEEVKETEVSGNREEVQQLIDTVMMEEGGLSAGL